MEITNRSFQVELMSRAHEVAESGEKLTTAHITPGGGKTRGGSLFGSILFNEGKVNQVVWVCPRQSLCDQVAEGFAKVETLGKRRRALRVASNDPPLSRDKEVTAGYTTTIQAITANLDLHRHHFERHRVLLIVDEFHHYPATGGDDESAAWSRAIKALAEMSTYVLAMTGTLQRNKDNRGIVWVEYDDERKAQPCHITYGRRDAIDEGSKLRFVPKYWDGPAEFDIRGVGLETRIEDPAQEVKRTITWSLAGNSPFVQQAVKRGISDWKEHRTYNQRAQCIVVCQRQQIARDVYNMLRAELGRSVGLAISDDEEKAREVVSDFRRGELPVMVSVDKAYEGLDAPRTTHIVCLRGYESAPWLEQCIDRATRIDYLEDGTKNEKKAAAYVLLPGTPGIKAAVKRIEAEQGEPLREPKKIREPEEDGPNGPGGFFNRLVWADIDGATFGDGTEELRAAEILKRKMPSFAGNERIIAEIAAQLRKQGKKERKAEELPELPRPGQERELRQQIAKVARRRDNELGMDFGYTNGEVIAYFGKSRTEMGVSELREVLEWLSRRVSV